jgi:carbohydrate diacid regulator
MLTKGIAESIVNETMLRLNRNINMMDREGIIIASGNRERIGERHAGASEAIRRNTTIAIDATNVHEWQGALHGINMPISFRDRVIGAIGITGEPVDISEFAELVRMTTEMMIEQTHLSSTEEWRRRTAMLLFEEFAKPHPELQQILKHFASLKLVTRDPMRMYAIQLEESGGMLHPEILHTVEGIWGSKRSIAGWIDVNQIVVLVFGHHNEESSSKLERMRSSINYSGIRCRVGCSGTSNRLEDSVMMYTEARFALSFTDNAREVVDFNGLEPRFFVSRLDEVIHRRYRDQLSAGLTKLLMDTLQSYFDNHGNIHQTAEVLSVHKNTVVYRLKKIKEITKRDPQKFHDAVALQLAMWMVNTERIE